MKPPGKATIIVALVVAAILAVFGYRLANSTRTYTYRTDYGTLPSDDAAFTEWLRTRPGVSGVTVAREGNAVVVVFVMAVLGSDPSPDIHGADERFGYRGRGSFSGGIQEPVVTAFVAELAGASGRGRHTGFAAYPGGAGSVSLAAAGVSATVVRHRVRVQMHA